MTQIAKMPRKIAKIANIDDRLPLDPTSSLNNYYMCVCKRRFTYKSLLIKHVSKCNKSNKKVVCHWCKLEFTNRGNLINHAHHMHGDKNSRAAMICDVDVMRPPNTTIVPKRPTKAQYKCDVCDAKFTAKWKMKFHIRRDHFNLWARIPHANAKQVNQVWFEKVLNTNLIMEIKKASVNRLIMKPTPKADQEIHEINKRVDLRNQYPIKRHNENVKCKICGKLYRKYDLKKHMDELHFNVSKHKCNNCNMTFKRSYIYLQHICHKSTNRRTRITGVRHNQNSSIRIANVETLSSAAAVIK